MYFRSFIRLTNFSREHILQQQIIHDVNKRLPYTLLCKQEWEVVPGHSQFGKGDLVFKQPGLENYLVIETKYIRTDSGKAARTARRRSRKKVNEQALRYGAAFKQLNPQARVEVATFTNESGLYKLPRR